MKAVARKRIGLQDQNMKLCSQKPAHKTKIPTTILGISFCMNIKDAKAWSRHTNTTSILSYFFITIWNYESKVGSVRGLNKVITELSFMNTSIKIQIHIRTYSWMGACKQVHPSFLRILICIRMLKICWGNFFY